MENREVTYHIGQGINQTDAKTIMGYFNRRGVELIEAKVANKGMKEYLGPLYAKRVLKVKMLENGNGWPNRGLQKIIHDLFLNEKSTPLFDKLFFEYVPQKYVAIYSKQP